MDLHHRLLDGRLHVYRRDNSRCWQCSTYLAGKNRRVSTKTEAFAEAKQFAEERFGLDTAALATIEAYRTARRGNE